MLSTLRNRVKLTDPGKTHQIARVIKIGKIDLEMLAEKDQPPPKRRGVYFSSKVILFEHAFNGRLRRISRKSSKR